MTPDSVQIERLREYEAALINRLLWREELEGKALCEWELLGGTAREIYVWVICEGTISIGVTVEGNPVFSSSSFPAVIYIDASGSVQSVEIPGAGADYARDIRRMFPLDVQERIFERLIDLQRLSEHLEWRRTHPEEPPLIVFSATPVP